MSQEPQRPSNPSDKMISATQEVGGSELQSVRTGRPVRTKVHKGAQAARLYDDGQKDPYDR